MDSRKKYIYFVFHLVCLLTRKVFEIIRNEGRESK